MSKRTRNVWLYDVEIIKAALAITAVVALLFISLPGASAQEGGRRTVPPFAAGKAYQFDKIADGIFYATSITPPVVATGSNDTIIVNDNGVMVVDDGMTLTAGQALVNDIKVITDKPVRWVVNTHYHYDHTSGNGAFGPDVIIIGQEYIRTAMLDLSWRERDPYTGAEGRATSQIDRINKQIAAAQDPAQKAGLEKRLAIAQTDYDDLEKLKTILPTPPNVTFTSKMTVYTPSREIQILFLGPGHTKGDTLVYLPKERIVCTGDLMEGFPEGPRISYPGDAMFAEWITTLDALKNMDVETFLPGHGGPFQNKAYVTAFQSYLKDFMTQAEALRKQGLTPEQAAPKIDLTSHEADFPFNQIKGPGGDIRGVRRYYEYVKEKGGE